MGFNPRWFHYLAFYDWFSYFTFLYSLSIYNKINFKCFKAQSFSLKILVSNLFSRKHNQNWSWKEVDNHFTVYSLLWSFYSLLWSFNSLLWSIFSLLWSVYSLLWSIYKTSACCEIICNPETRLWNRGVDNFIMMN